MNTSLSERLFTIICFVISILCLAVGITCFIIAILAHRFDSLAVAGAGAFFTLIGIGFLMRARSKIQIESDQAGRATVVKGRKTFGKYILAVGVFLVVIAGYTVYRGAREISFTHRQEFELGSFLVGASAIAAGFKMRK
jgi:hypothetical protein